MVPNVRLNQHYFIPLQVLAGWNVRLGGPWARDLLAAVQVRMPHFSRSRLAARSQGNATTINEPEFEARLAQKGVDIVHTQELSLAEQIRLVNSRRTIIGLWGSALHNILFALDGSKLVSTPYSRPLYMGGFEIVIYWPTQLALAASVCCVTELVAVPNAATWAAAEL